MEGLICLSVPASEVDARSASHSPGAKTEAEAVLLNKKQRKLIHFAIKLNSQCSSPRPKYEN